MEKATVSVKENLDKNFVAHLMTVLKAQGGKVEAQFYASAPVPAPKKDKKD